MRAAAVAVAAGVAAALSACGSSPGDLLALEISGGPTQAHDEIVIRPDGGASCNRGRLGEITNSQLLTADAIVRDAKTYTSAAQSFPPGPAGGRAFTLRDMDGTVRWYESSRGLPSVLPRAELLALELQPKLCGGQ